MAQILRQSTAVDVLIGPFLDLTDAATAETLESPSVKLSKNGQTLAAKNDVTTPTHDADGYYNCELDATDTNTVGTLILTVAASATALPVRHEFQIIEEAAYDATYATNATGPLQPTVAGRTLDVAATGEAGVDFSNVNGTIDAGDLGFECITGDKLSATAITKIGGGVWDEDATAHQLLGSFGAAIGDPAANAESIYDAVITDATGINVATDCAAILADTNELQTDWANGGRLDLILDGRAAEASITALNDISVADILTTGMTESYNADGVAPTLAQALFLLISYLTERAVSGTTMTTKQLDGITTAATFTLDDAVNPTSVSRAT